jgi:hypothetical protein
MEWAGIKPKNPLIIIFSELARGRSFSEELAEGFNTAVLAR